MSEDALPYIALGKAHVEILRLQLALGEARGIIKEQDETIVDLRKCFEQKEEETS